MYRSGFRLFPFQSIAEADTVEMNLRSTSENFKVLLSIKLQHYTNSVIGFEDIPHTSPQGFIAA